MTRKKRKDEAFDSARIDPNKFLRVDVNLTSESVMPYYAYSEDGSEKIEYGYLPAEELARLASVKVNGLVSNEHPWDMIDGENHNDYTVGYLDSSLELDKGILKGQVVIVDQSALGAIMTGKTDVSIGYSESKDYTPGVFVDRDGIEHPYDYIKKDIVINHVALCEAGRNEDAKLIFDSKLDLHTSKQASLKVEAKNINIPKKHMKVKIGDYIIDVEGSYLELAKEIDAKLKEVSQVAQDSGTQVQQLSQELTEVKTVKDNLESELSGIRMALEAANKAESSDEKMEETKDSLSEQQIQEAVTARLDAWKEIGGIDNGVVSFDAALSPVEVKKAYLVKQNPTVSFDSVDAAFVEGFFSATRTLNKKAASNLQVGTPARKNPATDSVAIPQHTDGTRGFSIFNK